MPSFTPHCPFDRLWQPGHPFRPRRSRKRRWCMAMLLIFVSGFISSYFYLTDSARIKAMSQAYLSDLVGGHVQINSGALTLFEGLKLSGITVTVDEGKAPDSKLFFASTIEIQYNPASLLRGRLEATRIIATGAKVMLVENGKKGSWNYQRLAMHQGNPSVTQPSAPGPMQFPELVLRDAQVQYRELENGQSVLRGSMDIDGRLFPSSSGSLYQFDLQSRGASEGVGPVVSGYVTTKTGQVDASLSRLTFGPDVEAMLPDQVRAFWEAHEFEGELDIPNFRYTPAQGKRHPATFHVETKLHDVKLIVRSEEFTQPPIADIQASPALARFPKLAETDRTARRMIAWLHPLPQRPPIQVKNVSGDFVFDEKGIRFKDLNGNIAGANLLATGRIDGYSPDAPIWCRVESKPGQLIDIPENPDFLPSLPGPVHQAYGMLHPHGSGTLWAELNRALPNGLPQITGEISVVNGCFDCIFFPYPIHGATGKVMFSPDPTRTFELVKIEDIRGHGVVGGPNEKAELLLSGWVGGDNPDVGCRIHARAKNISGEPAAFEAFPPPVRKVMTIFKGPGDEVYPHFTGDFDCTVFVPPGVNMRPIVSVDLNFKDGAGKLTAFPYPLEKMSGQVQIRDGYLDVKDVNFKHANATVNLNGRVTWPVGTPDGVDVIAKPDLKLVVRSMALDNELLKVLPAEARGWLRTAGATGMLDVDGHITDKPNATRPEDSVAYDLDVCLRDGSAHPLQSDYVVSDVAGKLKIHPDRMEVLELHGKRGDALLCGSGTVDWSNQQPVVKLEGSAQRMTLEPALRDLLPSEARQGWAMLDPHGIFNADLSYKGTWPAPPGEPIASLEIPTGAVMAIPQNSTDDFKLTLQPLDVSVTAKPLPYRLEHCSGTITVTPRDIVIEKIHGRHNDARIEINGKGITDNPNDWDLGIKAAGVPVDAELRKALPAPLRQVLDDLKYKGNLSVDMKSFRYRGDRDQADVDMAGTLSADHGSVEVGVPIDKIDGAVTFSAAVRGGKLVAFRGDAAVASMQLADRPLKDFKATLDLPANSDVLHVTGIRSDLAGGELAGQMDLKFPDTGPSSYLLDFQVKNADLREMAKQVAPKGQEIRGLVSASLALQGEWTNPATRRGRGDVLVSGKQMYQIPLLLGLLEVTNLSLPTSSPFSEGTARYLVEGNRVTFEQVQMRSSDMLMSGNGWLDFGSKLVRMNFTTENPNLPKLPIVNDLWEGAKQELLQIQVRGTVQSPTVSAGSLHTFTTTVDEVFSGSGKER
jgi:hypothetical protein